MDFWMQAAMGPCGVKNTAATTHTWVHDGVNSHRHTIYVVVNRTNSVRTPTIVKARFDPIRNFASVHAPDC